MQQIPNDLKEAADRLREDIPPVLEPSSEELERRRKAVQLIDDIRERIGPIRTGIHERSSEDFDLNLSRE